MPQVNLGKNHLHQVIKYFDLICDVADAWASVRDNPKMLDWAAFGIKIGGIAYQTHKQWASGKHHTAWDFLEKNESTWKRIQDDVGKMVMQYAVDATVVPSYWDGDPETVMLVEGKVGAETVRWLQEGHSASLPVGGPYVLIEREKALLQEVGSRLWRALGTKQLVYMRGHLTSDKLYEHQGVITDESGQLYDRLLKFYQQGEVHSCLLVGPPGAGKSTAIRQVAARLNLSTLKLSVSSLSSEDGASKYVSSGAIDGVRSVLNMLQPDVVILEDLDRMAGDSDLLDLLEVARLTSKLVIASANGTESMMGAALRPGRFDDVIIYAGLDESLTRELSHGNEQVAERLKKLPLVYAYEYSKRYRVLGAEAAEDELEELEARAERCVDER